MSIASSSSSSSKKDQVYDLSWKKRTECAVIGFNDRPGKDRIEGQRERGKNEKEVLNRRMCHSKGEETTGQASQDCHKNEAEQEWKEMQQEMTQLRGSVLWGESGSGGEKGKKETEQDRAQEANYLDLMCFCVPGGNTLQPESDTLTWRQQSGGDMSGKSGREKLMCWYLPLQSITIPGVTVV